MKMLMQRIKIAVIVFGGLAFISGCALLAGKSADEAISMSELPDPVRPLAEKEVDGCEIKEVEREMKDGKTIYAITYYDRTGTLMEVEYAEDGALISKGKE